MRKLHGKTKSPEKGSPGPVGPRSVKKSNGTKDFQLVLQFRGDSLADYDAMVSLEDELIGTLGDSADVDGHDVGSGEVNIFIFTSNPAATFEQLKPTLESGGWLNKVTAAYREVAGEIYTAIWPPGSRAKFRII